MTNYNDGNWHGWNGGECPVHPETVVKWVHEDGYTSNDRAGDVFWIKGQSGIAALRVIKEHKEPREFWIFTNGHGDKCVSGTWRDDAIHVREVLE